jgi:hypothetical protein
MPATMQITHERFGKLGPPAARVTRSLWRLDSSHQR